MANEWVRADDPEADDPWARVDDTYKPDMSAATPNLRREAGVAATAASRLVTGPGQVATAVGEKLGIPGADVAAYTEAVNAIEEKLRGGGELDEKDRGILNTWQLLTGAAVPAAGAGKVLGASSKVLPAIGKGAAAGAAGGAMGFDPSVDTANEGLIGPGVGALLGATGGLAGAAIPAVRNFIFREFQKAPTPEAQANLNDIAASPLTSDLPLSNAQRTGRYEAEVLEGRVAGTVAQDFYNKQLAGLQARMERLAASAGGPEASDLALEAQKAISGTKRSMQAVASNEYEAGVNRAIAKAAADPANNFGLRADTVFKTFNDMDVPPDAWQKMMDPASAKYAKQVLEIQEVMAANGGTLGMVDMIRLHQAANRMRSSLNALGRNKNVSPEQYSAIRMGNKIADAVEKDVDIMSAKLAQARKMPTQPGQPPANFGKGYEDAWAEFEKTNNGYRQAKAAQEQVDAYAFTMAFRDVPKDAADTWRKMMNMSPTEQRRAINIMREHRPEMLRDVKAWKLRDVTSRMFDPTQQGGKNAMSVDNFVKELSTVQGKNLAGSELWSPEELKHLKAAVAYARMIENKAPVRGQQFDVQSGVMAVASRSTAFLARAIYQAVAVGKAEQLFFTPQGIASLRTLATTSDPSKQAYQAALGYLGSLATKGEAPDESETEEFAVAP